MRRIYFLLPTIEVARKVVDDLLLARIDEHHIHVIAKEGKPMEEQNPPFPHFRKTGLMY